MRMYTLACLEVHMHPSSTRSLTDGITHTVVHISISYVHAYTHPAQMLYALECRDFAGMAAGTASLSELDAIKVT